MKKVVIFGGGSGLSNILRSIKDLEVDLSVFVTVSDNGGSTGKIRKFYNVPAPGDLRRAIVALSEDRSAEELMNYRFDDKIDNHTIGNLILAALTDIENDIGKAVERYAKMLDVNHKIYPVSLENVTLSAILSDDTVIHGETEMVKSQQKIEHVFYENKACATNRVVEEIMGADYIIFSSGSLFTSILSNVVFDNSKKAIKNTDAKIIYIANLVTEKGETDDCTLSDHINIINRHFNDEVIDYVLANNNFTIDEKILNNYEQENSNMVQLDIDKLNKEKVILNNYIEITEDNYIRHNTKVIADDLMKIFMEDI